MIDPPRVSVTVHADRVRVELAGDVDVSVPQLQPAVATAGAPRLPVDVDCSRVTFMDSSGAQFLAHLVTTVHPHRVHVLDPPRRVHDLLERMALDTVLDLDAPL